MNRVGSGPSLRICSHVKSKVEEAVWTEMPPLYGYLSRDEKTDLLGLNIAWDVAKAFVM